MNSPERWDGRFLLRTKSDGGSSSYYDIPEGTRDVGDLIEHRKMSFGVGNIFKACYRLGRKAGVDDEYDLRKIIYFAQRELEYVKRRRQGEADATQAELPFKGGTVQSSIRAIEEGYYTHLGNG